MVNFVHLVRSSRTRSPRMFPESLSPPKMYNLFMEPKGQCSGCSVHCRKDLRSKSGEPLQKLKTRHSSEASRNCEVGLMSLVRQ